MKAGRWAAFAAGLLLAATTATTAEAAWRRAESAHFVVYSEGSEGELRTYVDDLEIFDGLLREMYRVPADAEGSGKLSIYLVDNLGELRRVYPNVDRNIAGFYLASGRDIFAALIKGRQAEHTIQHEYLHHFMLQHRAYAYPAWLIEGLAEYWATADIERDSVTVGEFSPSRVRNLTGMSWVGMEDLLRRRPGEIGSSEGQAMYYAQAWLLTHYLQRDPKRQPQLASYMKAVGEAGADPVKAMESATGMSARALEGELRRYLGGRIVSERYAFKSARQKAAITVTTLSASADDLLLETQALKRPLSKAEGEALLATVRTRAARHPDDRLARVALARAELAHGDRARGEAALEAQLKAGPDDAEALTLLATSRMDRADDTPTERTALFNDARRLLARAYKLDPKRYQTVYAAARSRSNARDYPTDADLETVTIAHELAPQVADIRLRAAELALRRGERDLAAQLAGVLANDPHGGGAARAAKALLEQARAPAAGPTASK